MSEAAYPVTTIAKLLILTERQVQSLARQGVMPKADRGRYELVPVVRAYIRCLRETLIPEDQVRLVVTAFVARFKQRTLTVAPKAAPLLAVEPEADTSHDIIETFLLEALAELAGMEVQIRSAPGMDVDPDDGGQPWRSPPASPVLPRGRPRGVQGRLGAGRGLRLVPGPGPADLPQGRARPRPGHVGRCRGVQLFAVRLPSSRDAAAGEEAIMAWRVPRE